MPIHSTRKQHIHLTKRAQYISRIFTVQHKYMNISIIQEHEHYKTQQKTENTEESKMNILPQKWTRAVKPIARRYIVWAIQTLYIKPLHSASLSLHLTTHHFRHPTSPPWFHSENNIHSVGKMQCFILNDRLCGLVVRIPDYRSRGAGFDSQRWDGVHSASWV
jgi:hypothetical protein